MDRLAGTWSALREPLHGQSFSEIKRLCAAAGMPIEKLSHLTQTGKGYASKSELLDAIDGLFMRMSSQEQDRVTGNLLADLLRERNSLDHDRIEELLERRGWALLGSEPVPRSLQINYLEEMQSSEMRRVEKAVRRYRDGDRAGAVTALVGLVDTRANDILRNSGGTVSARTPLHQRVKNAHQKLKPLMMAKFKDALDDPKAAWAAQHTAVVAAANLLAQLRRDASDVHGHEFDSDLLGEVARTAVFILDSLSPQETS